MAEGREFLSWARASETSGATLNAPARGMWRKVRRWVKAASLGWVEGAVPANEPR
jgi:hypothetical protein